MASATPSTTAAAVTRTRVFLDCIPVVVVILATLSLALGRSGHTRRAPGWRRQRRWRRILLQHLLELRIHRRGTAADGDLRQLVPPGELVGEGMLTGQI